jgi:hypothetical protein
MTSFEHEAPLLLLREAPAIVPRLLAEVLKVELPEYSALQLASAELPELVPAERRADLVVIAEDDAGSPVMAIVVEVQRTPNSDKHYSWPQYLANLHARHRCLTWLVVLSEDSSVAAWARKPIETFHPNPGLAPLVIGPSEFPRVTDSELARAAPELAVLSVLMHRESAEVTEIAAAALDAAAQVDDPRSKLYADLILSSVPDLSRIVLERLMDFDKYEYKSDFARKYIAKGRLEALRDAIIDVLSVRGLSVDTPIRARLESESNVEQLRLWLSRAVTVSSTEAMFADG